MRYTPDDYDKHGMLRLPWLFWLVLLLQARTCLLFVIAGVSREGGEQILNFFYPESKDFWLGMITGLPAALAFLLSGRRYLWPKLWHFCYPVLLISMIITMGVQGNRAWSLNSESMVVDILLLLFDILALGYLLFSRRVIDCFKQQSIL